MSARTAAAPDSAETVAALAALPDQLESIVADVFAAMVDGEPGRLAPWPSDEPLWWRSPPLVGSVDLRGPAWSCSVRIVASRGTVRALARALLRLDLTARVADDDAADALGELLNIVAGNVKAVLPQCDTLGLPGVRRRAPVPGGPCLARLRVSWRGRPLVVTVRRSVPRRGSTEPTVQADREKESPR